MPVKKEIVYPIFLECCTFCENNFWTTIFEDLAYTKCPSGTYINKDFLTCSYKGKEFSYKIERKDPKLLYTDIYNLLTKKLNIFSSKEKLQKKIIFNEIEECIKNSRLEWGGIRKKTIKDSMYECYVLDMKKKHNLSLEQAKYLLSLILVAITFKTITSKNIIYEKGKIQEINCIKFDNGKISLDKPLCIGDKIDDEEETKECPLSELWSRYLKSLKNHKK